VKKKLKMWFPNFDDRSFSVKAFAFFALLVLAFPVFSQEVSQLRLVGSGKQLSDELLDRNVRDANHEVCAGLMVASDIDGLSYDANNGVVKLNHSPGRDLLFLQAGERVVTVMKTGYKPLKVILSEAGVHLKSGEVWQVEITGNKKLDQIPISIVIDPSDATILIDGVNRGSNKTQQASPGKHTLRIEKEGYKPIEEVIDVSSMNILFTKTLAAVDVQPVSIKSVPSGARFTINSLDKGVTDKGLFLYPGRYKLKLGLSGYLDLEKEIDVSESGKNEFAFSLVKNSGIVNITVNPPDATVKINKEDYTGKATIELPPGRYKIDVEKEGYVATSEAVDVVLEQTVVKTYALIARTGNLQFSVSPLEAKTQLRRAGVVVQEWQGMKLLKGLPVGTYDLEINAGGYRSVKKTVTIQEGKAQIVEAVMEKESDVSSGMVLVEGGTFEMGSENGSLGEKPVHQVSVSSFFIDKYEVTVGQYRQFCTSTGRSMPSAPSWGWQENHPIVNVTWDDAAAYAQWAGKRLPTEAEWEYAARGGRLSKGYTYSGGKDLGAVAWYDGNSGKQTQPVGEKSPNELGICDMSGNAWEWCADWDDENYYRNSPKQDPTGPSSGQLRVLRGGSWLNVDSLCRLTNRNSNLPSNRNYNDGFRCAQDAN
jgi:formylglycine-generating enzyme required for sulfatase activity